VQAMFLFGSGTDWKKEREQDVERLYDVIDQTLKIEPKNITELRYRNTCEFVQTGSINVFVLTPKSDPPKSGKFDCYCTKLVFPRKPAASLAATIEQHTVGSGGNSDKYSQARIYRPSRNTDANMLDILTHETQHSIDAHRGAWSAKALTGIEYIDGYLTEFRAY